MELYLARDEGRRKMRLVFPATFSQVRDAVQDLEELGGGFGRVHIKDAEGAAKGLVPYIRYTELEWANGVDKLNELARRFDGMDADAQKLLFGALEMRIANNIYDVLEVLSELDQYELISEAATDWELGEWVVAQGKLGVELPAEALPFLDYPRIGADHKASHGGTYTTSGYMKRREMVPEQAVEDKPKFALTLISISDTYRLDLPASDEQLRQARQALKVSSLGGVMFSDIKIDYPWAHLLPLDSITLEDANNLAQYLQRMSGSELRLFGAALDAEEPRTFSDAVCIAEELDVYELVVDSEGEYGREALRYAGAGDEILDMLDGFTDFDALGRFEMEQDGVRETSYGSIKRLSSPFPKQEMGQTMC